MHEVDDIRAHGASIDGCLVLRGLTLPAAFSNSISLGMVEYFLLQKQSSCFDFSIATGSNALSVNYTRLHATLPTHRKSENSYTKLMPPTYFPTVDLTQKFGGHRNRLIAPGIYPACPCMRCSFENKSKIVTCTHGPQSPALVLLIHLTRQIYRR